MPHALALIVLLPLAGFLLNGLAGNRAGTRFVSVVGCGLPIIAFGIAIKCFLDLAAGGGAQAISLAGAWHYQIERAVPSVSPDWGSQPTGPEDQNALHSLSVR